MGYCHTTEFEEQVCAWHHGLAEMLLVWLLPHVISFRTWVALCSKCSKLLWFVSKIYHLKDSVHVVFIRSLPERAALENSEASIPVRASQPLLLFLSKHIPGNTLYSLLHHGMQSSSFSPLPLDLFVCYRSWKI